MGGRMGWRVGGGLMGGADGGDVRGEFGVECGAGERGVYEREVWGGVGGVLWGDEVEVFSGGLVG